MSTWLTTRVAGLLERRVTRRSVLVRAAVAGSALVVDPLDYILHPTTAYAVVCGCGDRSCSCGDACCDGYTEFCCTLTGSNTCPSGTVAGGWWRADGSSFCGGGPRYYIDCHGECSTVEGDGPFCPDSDGLSCGCALESCGNRVAGCVEFRYGQCHQEIAQMGRIACRVVTCTPAYMMDNACTTTALYDEATAEHNRPCLQAPPLVTRAYGATPTQDGLFLVGGNGGVYTFGNARFHGSMAGQPMNGAAVGLAVTASGNGYWLVAHDGGVFAFGDAPYHGSLGNIGLVAPIVGMAALPDGRGYWLVAADGGVFTFGAARFLGSLGGGTIPSPIVGITAVADGSGYWLVASDGTVYPFGTASAYGSTAGRPLPALIGGLVPSSTGKGYWLWGEDGSIYPFGDAGNFGDYPHLPDAKRDLPSDGIDAFYAMVEGPAGAGYTLWAVTSLAVPPQAKAYTFAPAPPPSPTLPTVLPGL